MLQFQRKKRHSLGTTLSGVVLCDGNIPLSVKTKGNAVKVSIGYIKAHLSERQILIYFTVCHQSYTVCPNFLLEKLHVCRIIIFPAGASTKLVYYKKHLFICLHSPSRLTWSQVQIALDSTSDLPGDSELYYCSTFEGNSL